MSISQTEFGVSHNADCFDILPSIESQSVDLVLCDLPFGVTRNSWDSVLDLNKLWQEYKRILKPNGTILLHATMSFAMQLINSNPKMFKYELIWNKRNSTGFLNAKNNLYVNMSCF